MAFVGGIVPSITTSALSGVVVIEIPPDVLSGFAEHPTRKNAPAARAIMKRKTLGPSRLMSRNRTTDPRSNRMTFPPASRTLVIARSWHQTRLSGAANYNGVLTNSQG